MKKQMLKAIGFGLMSLLLISCMRNTKPDWVLKETTAYLGKKAFYGVGSVGGVKNEDLAQMTSENQARIEVTKLMNAYAEMLVQEYTASLPKAEFKRLNENQNIAMSLRSFANTVGSQQMTIIDSWQDQSNGTFYTLAELPLKTFRNAVAKANDLELESSLRQFVVKNAQEAFGRFQSKRGR